MSFAAVILVCSFSTLNPPPVDAYHPFSAACDPAKSIFHSYSGYNYNSYEECIATAKHDFVVAESEEISELAKKDGKWPYAVQIQCKEGNDI